MSTLLLRLAAPMQSYGIGSKFDIRTTERVPTKSAVVGLLAAALGRTRDQGLDDLNKSLRFGVRTEREGSLLRDYHTAKSQKSAYVTHRYYLCDAVFLVGLQGEDALLEELAQALVRPAFPLFLGRRSCPVEGKLVLGIQHGVALEDALAQAPRLVASKTRTPQALRLQTEAGNGEPGSFLIRDVPLSFDPYKRQHGLRRVKEWKTNPAAMDGLEALDEPATAHDAFAQLGGE